MPKNKRQERVYAFITVLITVPCFVLYCLSIENGGILNVDPIFGLKLIPIEIVLALFTELFIAGPIANKIAFNLVNPKEDKPLIIQLAIISSTVFLMVPLMSFWATIVYTGVFPALIFKDTSFELAKFFIYFIPNWLQTVVLNFPFALFSQIFVIQPLTKRIFNLIYKQKQ